MPAPISVRSRPSSQRLASPANAPQVPFCVANAPTAEMSGRAQPSFAGLAARPEEHARDSAAVAHGRLGHDDRDRQEAAGILEKVAEVELPVLGIEEARLPLALGVEPRRIGSDLDAAQRLGYRLRGCRRTMPQWRGRAGHAVLSGAVERSVAAHRTRRVRLTLDQSIAELPTMHTRCQPAETVYGFACVGIAISPSDLEPSGTDRGGT